MIDWSRMRLVLPLSWLSLHWPLISIILRTFSGRLWRGQRLHCRLSEKEARVSVLVLLLYAVMVNTQEYLHFELLSEKPKSLVTFQFVSRTRAMMNKMGPLTKKGLTFMDKRGWRRMETRLEMKRLNILTHQSLETQTHQSSLLKHKRGQKNILTHIRLPWQAGKTAECQRLRSKGQPLTRL